MKQLVNALHKLNCGKSAYAVFALCAATAVAAPAQTFSTLFSFDGTDGASPPAGLVQGTDGNFYGTTQGGGANTTGCGNLGCGTVFKITASGKLTTLYTFCSQGGQLCTDGEYPYGGLIQATGGSLYGTTGLGGVNTAACVGGYCGTVFKMAPSGKLTTLYSFCSQGTFPYCSDGEFPNTGPVQATDGNLYGTTVYGGSDSIGCGNFGCGTVFKMTPSGKLTTLYTFFCSEADCTDGANPASALVQGTDGSLYGTTYGTVFKITSGGKLTTLYRFCSQGSPCLDGSVPNGLVEARDGNFYGTTKGGGANTTGCSNSGCGTVFKMTPSGNLTTLYSFFCSQTDCADGAGPASALVQATDGNLYGTTAETVFKITLGGKLTTLYSFCSQTDCADGEYPAGALIQATGGNFYGTTEGGGINCMANAPLGCGTIFRLSEDLGPSVETRPTSGKIGSAVKILGTDLIGATSVTFNGTAASFTVVRPSEITTTVPVGASSGTVQVVTPNATLLSDAPFRVP